jgi:DNA-directed RNA polymerase subunit RPC12/RpoP
LLIDTTISSRTPEGDGYRCRLCGRIVALEESPESRDVPCPSCGELLWRFRDAVGNDMKEIAELVAELQKEFDVQIPANRIRLCRSVEAAVRLVQSYRAARS